MCSTDVYCSKQTGSSSTKGKNHHPSFLRFWNWAEENCRCSQNLWRRRNVVKTETANIRKWIARFYYASIYPPLEARVLNHNNYMSCPSCWATLSTLLINILLGSFQLFLHSDQPLSEGEIIRSASVCQSGGGTLSTRKLIIASCRG